MIRGTFLAGVVLLQASGAAGQLCDEVGYTNEILSPGVDVEETISAGDFNQDGHLDILVSSLRDSGIGILLGNGDGTFADGFLTPYPDQGIYHCVLEDFNHDGVVDIGATGYISDRLNVRLSGIGTNRYRTGEGGIRVRSADLDQDGNMDLITANLLGGTVGVWHNNGNGFPALLREYEVGGQVQDVGAGDFNNDGILDLICSSPQIGDVYLMWGQPDRTYIPGPRYDLGSPRRLSVADFDMDGSVDFALVTGQFETLQVYSNLGSGFFFQQSAHRILSSPRVMTSVDLDLDGDPDLATLSSREMNVLINDGAGGFSEPIAYPTLASSEDFVFGEFDDIPGPDVAIVGEDESVTVLMNKGDGSFVSRQEQDSGNFRPKAAAAGDFNGDGLVDAVILSESGSALSVFLNDGDGDLEYADRYSVGSRFTDVEVFDFDLDGDMDLLAVETETDTLAFISNNGDGSFVLSESVVLSGVNPSVVRVVDLDGDGVEDILIAYLSSPQFDVMVGNGDGTFQTAVVYPSIRVNDVVVSDLDGDGDPDVLSTGGLGGAEIWVHMNTGETFGTATTYTLDRVISSADAVDVNGDGSPDLVAVNPGIPAHGELNGFMVFLNNGDGTLGEMQLYENEVVTGMAAIKAGDFDADGDADVAYLGGGYGLAIRYNDGTGSFDALRRFDSGSIVSPRMRMDTADINADGIPDFVIPNYNDHTLVVVESICSMSDACVPDFNDDGLLDFFDVSAFLTLYLDGDSDADLNGDGELNFFDVTAFIQAFNAGCP